jgi:hypothetical protein
MPLSNRFFGIFDSYFAITLAIEAQKAVIKIPVSIEKRDRIAGTHSRNSANMVRHIRRKLN